MESEFRVEIDRLREALRKKETECNELMDELKEYKKMVERMGAKMDNMREEIRNEMDAKLEQRMGELVKSYGLGAVGGERDFPSTPKDAPRTEGHSEIKDEGSMIEEAKDVGRKKKKTGKNRRHQRRLNTRKSKSIDSLYSSEDPKDIDEKSEGSEDTESYSEVEVKKSILIREIPSVPKYNVYGSKEIKIFSRNMRNIAKQSFRIIKFIG